MLVEVGDTLEAAKQGELQPGVPATEQVEAKHDAAAAQVGPQVAAGGEGGGRQPGEGGG